MTFINIILLALIPAIAFSRGPLMLYVFFASFSLGSVAVIPPEMVAGVTLTPTWIYAIVMAARILSLEPDIGAALGTLIDPRKFGLLTLCTIYASISALLFPRLFAYSIEVIPMHLVLHVAIPLVPSNSNITQMLYFALTTLIAWSLYLVARNPAMRPTLLNALLFGGAVMVASGWLDMATAATGMKALLEPLRTATYGLLTDVEIADARRVVGLQPEASSYAGGCMGFLAPVFFLRETYIRKLGHAPWMIHLSWILLAAMTYLSTSSSGVVGLAVFAAVAIVEILIDTFRGRRAGWMGLGVAWLGAVAVGGVYAVDPGLFDPIAKMINTLIFQKTASDSYAERSMWNVLALRAFSSTYGLGAGLGSVRASSWIAAVLGNIGVVGACLMFGFLALVAFARGRQDAMIARGAKFAAVPILAMMALSGTSVGFGPMVAGLAGLVGGVSWQRKEESSFLKKRSKKLFRALRGTELKLPAAQR